jgi:hypothetical protein
MMFPRIHQVMLCDQLGTSFFTGNEFRGTDPGKMPEESFGRLTAERFSAMSSKRIHWGRSQVMP